MKCLILCGGSGTIDPETRNRIPKCMLKIGNRPLIWHVMKTYSRFGVSDFVLALGLGADFIKNYFINSFEFMHDIEVDLSTNNVHKLNQIPEENWNIKLIDTGISARTGARISRCERYLKHDSFLIAYSDILSDVNIDMLIQSHYNSNKLLTITGTNPISRFGTFKTSHKEISYDMTSKIRMEDSCINGGFMIADKSIFNYVNPINECDLESEIFPILTQEDKINIFSHDGFWHNVDTERDINYFNQLYMENKRPWLGIN